MGRSRRGPGTRAGLIGVVAVVAASAFASGAWARTTSRPAGSPSATTACTSVTYSLSVTSASTASAALAVTGQIDFAHGAATASVTLPSTFPVSVLAGTDENVVLVGGTLYLSVPPSLQGDVGGASWVYLTLPSTIHAAVDALGTMLADWCGSGQSLVSFLGSHGVSVTSLGSASVGGVTVNGAALTAKGRRVAKLAKVARRVDRYLPPVGGRTPVTFDAWTDPEGQITELSADLGSFAVALSLTNIDKPVTIAAPAGAVPLPGPALGMLGGLFSAKR